MAQVLVLTMCTSVVPTTMAFAADTGSQVSSTTLKSVSISGTEEVGHKLKAKVNYSGTKPSLDYQWQRASKKDGDYTDISGADEEEYKLKSSDENKYIKVVVSATINGTNYDKEDITSRIDENTSKDDNSDSSTSSSSSTSSNGSNDNSNNVIIRSSTGANISSQASGSEYSTSNNLLISPTVAFTNPAGHLLTGWVYSSNKWYYLDKDGRAKVGWVLYNNKWYYLDQSGVMLTNTTINGYTLGDDGAMI